MGREFDTLKENETEKVVYCNTNCKIYQFATLTDLFNIYKNEFKYPIFRDFCYEEIQEFFHNTETEITRKEIDLLSDEFNKSPYDIEKEFMLEE